MNQLAGPKAGMLRGEKAPTLNNIDQGRGLDAAGKLFKDWCWNCGEPGHRMSECPNPKGKGKGNGQSAMYMELGALSYKGKGKGKGSLDNNGWKKGKETEKDSNGNASRAAK